MLKLRCVTKNALRLATSPRATLARSRSASNLTKVAQCYDAEELREQQRWSDDGVRPRRAAYREEDPVYFVPARKADVLEELTGVIESCQWDVRRRERAKARLFIDYEECMPLMYTSPFFIRAKPSISSPPRGRQALADEIRFRQNKRKTANKAYEQGRGTASGRSKFYTRASARQRDQSNDSRNTNNNRFCEDNQRVMPTIFRHWFEAVSVTAFLGIVYHFTHFLRRGEKTNVDLSTLTTNNADNAAQKQKCVYAEALRAALEQYVFRTTAANEFYVLPPVSPASGLPSAASISSVVQNARAALLAYQHPGDLLYAIPPQNEFDGAEHSSYTVSVDVDESTSRYATTTKAVNGGRSLRRILAETFSPPRNRFNNVSESSPKAGRVARELERLQVADNGAKISSAETTFDIPRSFFKESATVQPVAPPVVSTVQASPTITQVETTTAAVVAGSESNNKLRSLFWSKPTRQQRRQRFSRKLNKKVVARENDDRQSPSQHTHDGAELEAEELFGLPQPPPLMPPNIENEMQHLMRGMKYAANSYKLGLQLFAESDPARYAHLLSSVANDSFCVLSSPPTTPAVPASSSSLLLQSLAKKVEHHHAHQQQHYNKKNTNNRVQRRKKSVKERPYQQQTVSSAYAFAAAAAQQQQKLKDMATPIVVDVTTTAAAASAQQQQLERSRSMPNLLIML